MKLTPQNAARALGIGRVVVGIASIAAPDKAVRTWIGEGAADEATQVMTRTFGARDVVLGVLNFAAATHAQGPALTALIGFVDAVDLGATAASYPHLPKVGAATSGALAGSVFVGSLVLAHQLKSAARSAG